MKDKQEELIELEADAERDDLEEQLSSMAKQVGTKLEALTTLSNMWAEFDQRMAQLSSWLNRHIDRFKNSKDSSSLKDSVFTLKVCITSHILLHCLSNITDYLYISFATSNLWFYLLPWFNYILYLLIAGTAERCARERR